MTNYNDTTNLLMGVAEQRDQQARQRQQDFVALMNQAAQAASQFKQNQVANQQMNTLAPPRAEAVNPNQSLGNGITPQVGVDTYNAMYGTNLGTGGTPAHTGGVDEFGLMLKRRDQEAQEQMQAQMAAARQMRMGMAINREEYNRSQDDRDYELKKTRLEHQLAPDLPPELRPTAEPRPMNPQQNLNYEQDRAKQKYEEFLRRFEFNTGKRPQDFAAATVVPGQDPNVVTIQMPVVNPRTGIAIPNKFTTQTVAKPLWDERQQYADGTPVAQPTASAPIPGSQDIVMRGGRQYKFDPASGHYKEL